MAFASFDSKSPGTPMSDINMVPLIDVMLVLLVIFIVTAPLLTQAVKLELPKASSQLNDLRPQKVDIAIDAAGALHWNGEPVARAELQQRLARPRRCRCSPSCSCAPTRASPTATSRRRWPMPRRPASVASASSASPRPSPEPSQPLATHIPMHKPAGASQCSHPEGVDRAAPFPQTSPSPQDLNPAPTRHGHGGAAPAAAAGRAGRRLRPVPGAGAGPGAGRGARGLGARGQRRETTMPAIAVTAKPETDATSLRATTTTVGQRQPGAARHPAVGDGGHRQADGGPPVDTLNQALKLMGGISFLAAEGGEQDIRLRGFSLSNDIYLDTIHDPGFYDRDTFNFERIELLRGSASMLFGRGSTGGVVNQVSKQAFLDDASVVNFTGGSDGFLRFLGDFNIQTGETSAVRINLMRNTADNNGNFIDKEGVALNFRWGIGTPDEFYASLYYLHNDNGINYGLPWLRKQLHAGQRQPVGDDSGPEPEQPVLRRAQRLQRRRRELCHAGLACTASTTAANCTSTLRYGYYDRDQRASTIRFCQNNAANANPDCPSTPQGLNTISDATILNRGTQNKVQDMDHHLPAAATTPTASTGSASTTRC